MYLSIYLSISLSVCLSIYLSVYPYIYLSFTVYLLIYVYITYICKVAIGFFGLRINCFVAHASVDKWVIGSLKQGPVLGLFKGMVDI